MATVLATGIERARMGTAIRGSPTPRAPLEKPPRVSPIKATASSSPEGSISVPIIGAVVYDSLLRYESH